MGAIGWPSPPSRASSPPTCCTASGWSVIALPPLLLLVGLVQLAYCDLTRRLLPKTLVYALSAAVIVSGVVIAGVMHEWHRLLVASLGGLAFFALFFVINLMNPRWMAFGDVRLSLVVGFGLAWVSPVALLEGFFFANLLAAAVGIGPDRHPSGRARVRRALRPLPGPGGRTRPRDLELSRERRRRPHQRRRSKCRSISLSVGPPEVARYSSPAALTSGPVSAVLTPGDPTPGDKQRWDRDGWCVDPGVIPTDQLAAAQEAVHRYFPTPAEMAEEGGTEAGKWHTWDAPWPEFPFHSSRLNPLVLHDRVVDLAEVLLGTSDLTLYMGIVTAKYANQPLATTSCSTPTTRTTCWWCRGTRSATSRWSSSST